MPTSSQPLVDVDLDALAPAPKKVKLAGQVFKLPGDMPLPLFFQLQAYEQRVTDGISEVVLLSEMRDALLELLQVHQPKLKELPPAIGLQTLITSLPAIYSAGAVGEAAPNRQTRRQRTRTTSAKNPAGAAAKATLR